MGREAGGEAVEMFLMQALKRALWCQVPVFRGFLLYQKALFYN
jgi:hypothetical protein